MTRLCFQIDLLRNQRAAKEKSQPTKKRTIQQGLGITGDDYHEQSSQTIPHCPMWTIRPKTRKIAPSISGLAQIKSISYVTFLVLTGKTVLI
ncbi:MAG: hypothetical protein M0Q44_05420 [Methylobacter sp.]|jgi:hypothetical protein|nr:hypothetical protein [Methylobacter sp.]